MELRAKRGGPYVLLKTPVLGMLKVPLSPHSLRRHRDYVAVLRETVDSAVEDEITSQDVSVIDPIVQVMAAPLPPEMGSVRRFLTKCGLAGYTLGMIENRDPVARQGHSAPAYYWALMLTQLQVETGNVQMDQVGAHMMDVGYYTARSGVTPATMASMIHVDR